jgi:outer membrane protein assembly factor BamB
MARSLVDGSKEWDAPVQLKATSRTGVTLDGTVAFVGDIRGNVYAIDTTDGSLRWTVNVGGFLESPIALTEGHLVVSVDAYANGSTARVVSLSEDTGDVDWHYDSGHPGYLTAPAIAIPGTIQRPYCRLALASSKTTPATATSGAPASTWLAAV